MKQENEVENLNNKPLVDFTSKDTLYIVKMYNGHSYTYLCQFISFRGRTVKARIIKAITPYAKLKKGDVTTAVAKSCYLWGQRSDDHPIMNYPFCHWFKNIKDRAGQL